MSDVLIGVVLIASLAGMIYYAVKGKNLMVGFTIISAIWLIVILIGNSISPNASLNGLSTMDVIQSVFQTGPEGYAKSILVNIFFGAFFGRVLIDTGIASTLIRKVVELGGDKPKITMILLNLVVALCFTSMTGIGPVISIAVIALPIMQALSIPSEIALFSFMGSIMSGILWNVTNFKQYQGILDGMAKGMFAEPAYSFSQYTKFGIVAMAVAFIVIMTVCCIALDKKKKSHAWAATAPNGAVKQDAPILSWLAVIMPVVLVSVFKIAVIPAFIVSALYALIVCGLFKGGYEKVCQMLAKQFTDGAVDVAPMIGFLLTLSMFSAVAVYAGTYFRAIVGGIFPTTAIGITCLLAVLIPLGFFRGPTNLVGCGTAIAVVILQVASWPVAFIYPLFSVTTIVPQHLDITQSWVAWGLGYTHVSSKDYMKYTILTGWVIGAILCFMNLALNGSLVG